MTTASSIAEQVAGHHRASAGQLPAEIAEAFAAEPADLAAADPRPACPARHPAARRNLLDVTGHPTTLATPSRFPAGGDRLLPRRMVPVLQHRPAHLPGRTRPRADRARHHPDCHQPPDARRLAIHQGTKELTFTVLSDPGNQMARQLGILTAPSDGTRRAAAARPGPDQGQRRRDNRAAHADRRHRRRRRRHPLDRRAPRLHHQNRARPDTAGHHPDDRVSTELGRVVGGERLRPGVASWSPALGSCRGRIVRTGPVTRSWWRRAGRRRCRRSSAAGAGTIRIYQPSEPAPTTWPAGSTHGSTGWPARPWYNRLPSAGVKDSLDAIWNPRPGAPRRPRPWIASIYRHIIRKSGTARDLHRHTAVVTDRRQCAPLLDES